MSEDSTGYVYGTTGTSPPLSTGTDPGSSVPSSSAPYGNYTYDPTGTGTTVSPTDPTGTVGSTGVYDPSGTAKLTYTAPTGVPTEYYYHHKKPKRDVSRSSSFPEPKEMKHTDRTDEGSLLPPLWLLGSRPTVQSSTML